MTTKLEYPKSLIKTYTAFRNEVYNPNSVLYSSCGFDASPSRVFKNVTFVDLEEGNEGCIDALKAKGLRAIHVDIRKYVPSEKYDLLLLQNPVVHAKLATSYLESGGWIIANNYHQTATQLNKMNDFLLWGTIESENNSPLAVISKDLTDLFEPVKDAEEYRRLRPKEYEFDFGMIENWISQGILDCPKDARLETKWKSYREELRMDMPSKRVSDYYIFRKK